MTRPPRTAVRRVDLRRQKDIVIGDINRDMERGREPIKPEIQDLIEERKKESMAFLKSDKLNY